MQLNLHMQPKQLKVINKMEFKDRLQKLMDENGVTSPPFLEYPTVDYPPIVHYEVTRRITLHNRKAVIPVVLRNVSWA
jgi:hypothetical protein